MGGSPDENKTCFETNYSAFISCVFVFREKGNYSYMSQNICVHLCFSSLRLVCLHTTLVNAGVRGWCRTQTFAKAKTTKKRGLGVSDGSGLHFRFVCVPGDKNGTAGPWHTADPYVNPAGKFNLCHYLWCVCVLAWSGGAAGSSRCTRCRLQRGGRWGRLNRSLRMDKQVTQTC